MTADKLVALVKLIEAGTISGNAGKKVLPSMFENDETVEAIVERMGLKQVSDEGAILAIVQDVLAKNEKAVADFKAGKNVTGFLVGQCMKASKGRALYLGDDRLKVEITGIRNVVQQILELVQIKFIFLIHDVTSFICLVSQTAAERFEQQDRCGIGGVE